MSNNVIELEFVQDGNGYYVAEPEDDILGCFNVHLESEFEGVANVYMKTAGNAYARCKEEVEILDDEEDSCCGEGEYFAIVFEKNVKIKTNVPITAGYLTIKEE